MKTSRMKSFFKGGVVTAALASLIFSCSQEGEEVSQRNFSISNDKAELNTRMTTMNQTVNVTTVPGGRAEKDFELVLKGELDPPSFEENKLQATSISRKGELFAVSYNFKGETYAGAIDLLTDDLEVTSQVIFSDADINDLTFSGSNLYFVGSTSAFSIPAFIVKIGFNQGKGTFKSDGILLESLGSYAANSVVEIGNDIYATSGDVASQGGGLYQLSSSLEKKGYQPIEDAKWVTSDGKSMLCVAGAPNKLYTFDKDDLEADDDFDHEGQPLPEAKMTVDVDKDLVFIAGGENGVLVYDLDGNLEGHITFSDNSITNAVSAEKNRLFISNGEGGVYVASYKNDIEIIGKLDLDTKESVNHILVHDDYLYVASGLGGVKMIEIKD
ncbi:hypothetical protein AAOE16_00655 [Ekhidna sp. MALMAid0563]|uniref:hypothetical protein n=1 Tax=Ekhidna sp. MALMAid0563 TaxID=3143937 RepID=UPI0032DF3CC5